MAEYTVVLVRMMSQVHNIEADDLKAAVARALELDTLEPDSGNTFDGAGETEVQVVELDGEEVWNSETDDESVIFE